MGKEVKNLENQGCPKVPDLLDEYVWILQLPIQAQDRTSLCRAQSKQKCLVTR